MPENDISDDYINQLISNLEKIDFDREFGGGKYREEIRENREKERVEIEKAKAAKAEIKAMKAEIEKIKAQLAAANAEAKIAQAKAEKAEIIAEMLISLIEDMATKFAIENSKSMSQAFSPTLESVFLSNAFSYFSSLSKETEQDEKNKNLGPQAKK